THEASKFGRRFRLPFPFYKNLVEECKRERWHGRFDSGDAVSLDSIPAEVSHVAVLQILGRGTDSTTQSWSLVYTRARFRLAFTRSARIFAKGVYKTWISAPEREDLKEFTATYARLGFQGAVGSCDVTHVRWDKAPAIRTVYYTGNEGFPSIAYQVTVDHTGRALAVTAGFVGANNDRTIRNDPSVDRGKTHEAHTQMEYTLVDLEGREFTEKRAYLIVDGGYHQKCPCSLRPSSVAISRTCLKWSKRLESVRKDVECFFGSLNGRFRILKMPLMFWASNANLREKSDNIFFVCCTLQSMLLAYGGL
ncbi:unnamed protein product, partial [Discosporangium mesarthrocarpum]